MGKLEQFKLFVAECVRVLRVTKKPTKEEYKTIVKVTGIGIFVLGLIGFFAVMIKQFITGML